METLFLSKEATQCLEAHLLGALAKWGPHLFIGTNGSFWNLGGFLTIQENSKIPYTLYV